MAEQNGLGDMERQILAKMASDITGQGANMPKMDGTMFDQIMNFPLPVPGMVDGIRYLLSKDERMLRACIIIEPDRVQARPDEIPTGSVIVSFVIGDPNDRNGYAQSFVNFEANIAEDLTSIAGFSDTVEVMSERLDAVLGGAEEADETTQVTMSEKDGKHTRIEAEYKHNGKDDERA